MIHSWGKEHAINDELVRRVGIVDKAIGADMYLARMNLAWLIV